MAQWTVNYARVIFRFVNDQWVRRVKYLALFQWLVLRRQSSECQLILYVLGDVFVHLLERVWVQEKYRVPPRDSSSNSRSIPIPLDSFVHLTIRVDRYRHWRSWLLCMGPFTLIWLVNLIGLVSSTYFLVASSVTSTTNIKIGVESTWQIFR